jgi:hypothetical protein
MRDGKVEYAEVMGERIECIKIKRLLAVSITARDLGRWLREISIV